MYKLRWAIMRTGMEDRRRSFRIRTLKSGKILLGPHLLSCTIRNLSGTGACLEVQSTYGIPPKFEFRMPNQSVRACSIVWAGETLLGVQFQ
jgi:hypothetical protein